MKKYFTAKSITNNCNDTFKVAALKVVGGWQVSNPFHKEYTKNWGAYKVLANNVKTISDSKGFDWGYFIPETSN